MFLGDLHSGESFGIVTLFWVGTRGGFQDLVCKSVMPIILSISQITRTQIDDCPFTRIFGVTQHN
jgi:hypothetical protein